MQSWISKIQNWDQFWISKIAFCISKIVFWISKIEAAPMP